MFRKRELEDDEIELREKGTGEEVPPVQAVGSTNLYENGQIRLIPTPSPDPKDPLNMTDRMKWITIGTMALFGSIALATEVIIASLVPVFLLEYSGIDASQLNEFASSGGAQGPIVYNPLSLIPPGHKAASIVEVSMLASVPFFTNGTASYFLVPLSIAIGRRPVMLAIGVLAWTGSIWAACSTSLTSHIGARALQGLGAGAVEALIPLIVQDMVFIHERNKAMSVILSSQGIIIIALGMASPYIATVWTWRYIYYITASTGFVAWVLMIAVLPETRWKRTKQELRGEAIYPLGPGEQRTKLDPTTCGPRTTWTTIGFFQFGFDWRGAGQSMLDTLRTTFFPSVVWVTLANSAFVITNQAVSQLAPFALLSLNWQFKHTGLIVLPFVLATIMVYFLGGPLSDRVSLILTRRNGVREPEYHLANMVIPFASGVLGCFIFGYTTEHDTHWVAIMAASFFVIFGFLMILTVVNVYMVESYPMWAGPVLVNVSSIRLIIAYFMSSYITTWVAEMGALKTFAIYAESLVVLSFGIPVLYFTGKRIRIWTAGKSAAA